MKLLSKLTVTALLCLSATPLFAEDAQNVEDRGFEIMTEAKKRSENWGTSQSGLEMILRNKQGQESKRQLRVQSFEVLNDGDKSLIIFDTPRDVKNTAFLSFSHPLVPDDQWLYLPALKRVKRISSRNKSGPFMGSEFSFEDMSSFEVEKYTYKFVKEESIDGEDYFIIESYPVDKLSGYTKQIAWVDQAEYRFRKVEFYDRKKSLLKTLTMTDFNLYLDHHWVPLKQYMVNHQTGKSTDLFMSNVEYGIELKESAFTKNALMRAR